MSIAILLLILFGVIDLSTWLAARHAPRGYEDERGFHFGSRG